MKAQRWNLHSCLLLILLLGVAACNETVPTNRPLLTAGQTDDGGDDDGDDILKRPDGEVFFKNNICGCKNGVNILATNDCSAFCAANAANTGGEERLYFSFSVGTAIELGPWQTVRGWCDTPIEGETAPGAVGCQLKARAQGETEVMMSVVPRLDGNSYYANISSLDYDKTYILTMFQTTSEVSSDSIQIRKLSDGLGDLPVGPVPIQPVTQYACIKRNALANCTESGECPTSGPFYYENALRQHFYFVEHMRPDPVTPGALSQIFCHNIQEHGALDNAQFPRLEENAKALALWSRDDVRMLTVNGRIDINRIIEHKLKDLGYTATGLNLFFPLRLSPGPVINEAGNPSNSGNNIALGFFMSSFRDSNNNAKCPVQADYMDITNPTFQVLGDLLQVDTEGVYLARREAQTDSSGKCLPTDWLIVRESEVSQKWFYYKNQLPHRPTQPSHFKNNKIIFFHPFVPGDTDPTMKKPNQRTYTIVLPSDASSGSCTEDNGGQPTTDELPTSIAPHDKRFGCVPVSPSQEDDEDEN